MRARTAKVIRHFCLLTGKTAKQMSELKRKWLSLPHTKKSAMLAKLQREIVDAIETAKHRPVYGAEIPEKFATGEEGEVR